MIRSAKKDNFIGLAEHREGHGYFILPATQDVGKLGMVISPCPFA